MKNALKKGLCLLAILCLHLSQSQVVYADIADGLQAYWNFEDGDDFGNDASSNNNDLAPITDNDPENLSGFASTEGIKGSGVRLNPDIFTLGLLENTGSDIIDTTQDFTWSIWFKLDPDENGDFESFGLMSKGPAQVGEVGEDFFAGAKGLILTSEGELIFDVFDIDGMGFEGDLADNRWHHAVLTNEIITEEEESFAYFALYVDGSLVSELELPVEDLEEGENSSLRVGGGSPGDDFLAGAWPFGEGGESSPSFIGGIDEVRVFDRAVSEDEVLELLFDGNPEPDPAVIDAQPMGGKAVAGRSYALSVSAKGLLLEYQWFKGDAEIEDATEPTLFFEELASDDSGDYKVVVTNPGGETSSETASLEVLDEWDSTIGLLAKYSFNESDEPGKDDSGNGYDLVDFGVTQVDGLKGQAIEVGQDVYLRDEDEVLPLNTLGSFTWTAMIKADGTQGNIMGKSDDEWGPGNKGLFIRDDELGFDIGWIGDGGGGTAVNDNEWHQVALRFSNNDGEFQQALFVDGALVGETELPAGDQPDSGLFAIGFASNDFPEFDEQETSNLIGMIDEVRVYNQALHEDDILTLLIEDGGSYQPAQIVDNPEDISTIEGRRARFTGRASGTQVTYQWQKDGVDIPDATDSVLVLSDVSKDDQGEYRFIAQSELTGDPVTSESATLVVGDAPVFGGGELAHIAPFLESFWSFDSLEDGLVPDLSPLEPKHPGELMFGAEITEGNQGFGGEGEALNPLAGESNAHMAAALPEAYNFDSAFTWSARVKLTEPAAEGGESGAGLFGRTPGDSGHAAGAKILFLTGTTLGFDQGWVGGFTAENELEIDNWHQVTMIYEPLEDVALISIYLDDEPVMIEGEEAVEFEFELSEFAESDDPPAEGGPGPVNSGFRIGSGATIVEEPFFSDPFPGLIDDVAVWSTVISPEDIALLASGASPLAEVIEESMIGISKDGDQITIEYTGTLYFSETINGEFQAVDGASSPYTVNQPGFYTSRP